MTSKRLTRLTVALNSRLVHFPQGTSAHAVFASLAKHREPMLAKCGAPLRKGVWLPLGAKQKSAGMPAHPLDAIAHTVAARLACPMLKASQRDAAPHHARGSNGRKKVVDGYTPAEGKQSVSFGGFAERMLSQTDVEEIRGCAALVLAELGNPDRLDFAAWKRIFSEARRTLRMKRKAEREHLLDSLEELLATDFHAELMLDRALIDARRAEAEAEAAALAEKRAEIAAKARTLLATIRAARRGDASRRARANFRTALRYLRRAVRAALGDGHAHGLTRTAAYEQHRAFTEYLSEGEKQLAREADEQRRAWEEEETARLMFAVSA